MTPAVQALHVSVKNMAVFIDADNLSNATALDHVFSDLQSRAERISYRRAYGRPESLKTIDVVLRKHGVRPVSNLVTNKVTTDIALTIDAVEVVCRGGINAVVICSGDADFVPLATWLREQGCFVLCFSMADQIFANPESFYDDVVLLEVVEKPTSMTESGPSLEPAPVLALMPSPACVSTTAASSSTLAHAPRPVPQQVDMVQQVLQAFPALRSGEPQHLSQVVAALRERGILETGTKTTTWFAQWASVFELLPPQIPNRIFYKKPSEVAPQKAAKNAVVSKPVSPAALPPFKVAQQTPALPEEVARILKAIPALRDAPQQLSQVVPVLRQKTILGKTTKSTAFFARHAAHFKLIPVNKPTHLSYVPARVVPVVPVVPVGSRGAESTVPATKVVAPAVLSWPVAVRRTMTIPRLSQELHGLRLVLLQLAWRRVTVADVLLAVPELLRGQPCALSAVAGRLRQHGLLRAGDTALRVLERYPGSFAIEMGCTPQTVIYVR